MLQDKVLTPKNPTIYGPELLPKTGNAPGHLVIFCHGLGADGNDLIGLSAFFSEILPEAAFVSPNAPFPCDMAPMGYQWFSLQNRDESSMLKGVQTAAPILNQFIDQQLEKFNLTEDKTFLVGFSQGTMMSLYVAPRRQKPLAGIIGYSGRLIGGNDLKNNIRSYPPVLLVNGDMDDLVPSELQREAVDCLTNLGVSVQGYVCSGLGHSIDQRGLNFSRDFIRSIIDL